MIIELYAARWALGPPRVERHVVPGVPLRVAPAIGPQRVAHVRKLRRIVVVDVARFPLLFWHFLKIFGGKQSK